MEDREHYVYALIHVEEQKVFYVGRARKQDGSFDRYQKHLSQARLGSHLPVHVRIRELQLKGQTIRFELRCTGYTYDESVTAEKRLISCYGLDNLTNVFPFEGFSEWGPSKETPIRPPINQAQKDALSYGRYIAHNRKLTDSEISRLRNQADNRAKPFYAKNTRTGEVLVFSGRAEASRKLGISAATLYYGIGRHTPVKGRNPGGDSYTVSDVDIFSKEGSEILTEPKKPSVPNLKQVLVEFVDEAAPATNPLKATLNEFT